MALNRIPFKTGKSVLEYVRKIASYVLLSMEYGSWVRGVGPKLKNFSYGVFSKLCSTFFIRFSIRPFSFLRSPSCL